MKSFNEPKVIGWRFWSKTSTIFYVANLPGDGGADWGYTTEYAKALPLSHYWAKRFRADCHRVGTVARFAATGETK